MALGLKFKNTDNDVIIDSDFYHYHFAGIATYLSAFRIPALNGGNNTSHSPSGGQTLSSYQEAGTIYKYKISTASSSSAAPMCFIKPSNVGTSAKFCGIILTRRDGADWEIWVLQDYGGTRPSLYCFLPLNDLTSSQKSVSGSYAVQTYNTSGGKTYDSRLKPLKIVGALTSQAPQIARTGAISNGYNPNFTPDQKNNYTFSTSTTEVSAWDLIFYCPSIAHCCQDINFSSSGDGFQTKGYDSYFYAWARGDVYWTFYRNTFRFTSQTNFQSSYSQFATGHFWQSQEKKSGILTAIIAGVLAVVTFGASLVVAATAVVVTAAVLKSFTNVSAASGLYFPYSNSGRNQSQSQPVLISKASYYA